MFDLRNWPLTWVAAAAIPLLGLYLYQRLCFYRFKQFEAVPQPAPPSLLWGSLQYMGQLMGSGDPRAHLDVKLLCEMDRLGWPPMLLVDLRPVSYPMLVVTSHDVAEQVSRPSKRFASSVPKSPTLGDIWTLTGRNSILLSEVSARAPAAAAAAMRGADHACELKTPPFHPPRAITGRPSARGSAPASRPRIS